MTIVEIGRVVDVKDLEYAVLKAAKEIGWKAKIKDNFTNKYRLGSVEEVRTYKSRQIRLSNILPQAEVTIYGTQPTDYFFISGMLGFASEDQVKKYLEAVSRNL